MLMSPIVLLTSSVWLVDFDHFDILHVLEIDQNTITSAYGSICGKQLYSQNQHEKKDTMALVSFGYDNFDF
jgi:hypothetical protein